MTSATPALRVLAAAVVATEIPYPLVHGHARDVLTVVTVVVFATASVAHALATRSLRTAAALLAVFGVGGFAAEVVGVHTGVPFGDYAYTGGLGASVAGVPLVIGLAWAMMAWPAMCVAARITTTMWPRIGTAVAALASWDVFLDPQMVDAHHWRWRHTHPHLPGIDDVPLSNFVGWLLVSLVLMTLAQLVMRPRASRADGPMVTLWVWTWLSSTLANVAFFHRPEVAGWGFVAMGVVGLPLLASLRRQAGRQ
jgi:putative membrane protein